MTLGILLVGYIALGLLTAVGAHRRNGSWWRSLAAGALPFATWVSW